MSLSIAVGVLVAVGCMGVARGLKPARPSLEAIAAALDRVPQPEGAPRGSAVPPLRSGTIAFIGVVERTAITGRRWQSLRPYFAVTGETHERVASKMLVLGGAAMLGPPLLWLLSRMLGVHAVPVGTACLVAILAIPVGLALPLIDLMRQARERQQHVRVVLSSFVDLVVLNLAGGMGIESALVTAAQVSPDWVSQRIWRSLLRTRESGQPTWAALSRLGEEIGVSELVELSASLELAGTEGSRIRQSLSARAEALRRHEQAAAESAASRTTERLFLPGALLLLGFLLFVGYPAFSRIVGGF